MLDKKIKYFVTVVEEGSFSAAARKLFLSQPTLSQQITILEDEIGLPLFDRTGYKPVLTAQGHSFYDGCLAMMQLEDETLKRIHSIGKNSIRIGFNGASANRPLLEAVKKFADGNSDVNLIFKKGAPEELVYFLGNDKIDLSFGLESDYRHISGIKYLPIYDYEMSILCSKEYPLDKDKPVALAEIADHPFEFLSASFGQNYFKEFKEAYRADGIKLNIAKYADNYDELVFDIMMGKVITISSKFIIYQDQAIVSVPLKDTHHTNRYVVAWNEKKGDDPYPKLLSSLVEFFKTL